METEIEIQKNIILIDEEQIFLDLVLSVLKESNFYVKRYDKLIDFIKNEEDIYNIIIIDTKSIEDINNFNTFKNKYKNNFTILLLKENDEIPSIAKFKDLGIHAYFKLSNNIEDFLVLINSGERLLKQKKAIRELIERLRNDRKKYYHSDIVKYLDNTIFTEGHSGRVSEYAILIGKELGLSKRELEILELGGIFHDIGKAGIPLYILNKDSKLNDEEYFKMKNHPVIGVDILSGIDIFEEVIPIVLYHHERWDGGGYPEGLKGKKIPKLARIISIADAFDAMTSDRVYQKALSIEYAVEEIEKNLGTQFDPEAGSVIVDIFKNNKEKILEINPIELKETKGES